MGPGRGTSRADAHRRAFAEASETPFWLDSPERPPTRPPLAGDAETELAIVGGGLSGLWAALLAKQRDPAREVVVVDTGELAGAASGRNGGFMVSFLTHGIENGAARFPEEMQTLERLGVANFTATCAEIERLGIDCDLERNGDLDVAVEPHELEWLAERPPSSPAMATRPSCSTATRYGRRSPRRCSRAGSGDTRAPRWSTRRGSAGGWPGPRRSSACGSTSGPRCGGWPERAGWSAWSPTRARFGPTRRCWRRAPSRG